MRRPAAKLYLDRAPDDLVTNLDLVDLETRDGRLKSTFLARLVSRPAQCLPDMDLLCRGRPAREHGHSYHVIDCHRCSGCARLGEPFDARGMDTPRPRAAYDTERRVRSAEIQPAGDHRFSLGPGRSHLPHQLRNDLSGVNEALPRLRSGWGLPSGLVFADRRARRETGASPPASLPSSR
jgi:hypothetical protein